MTTRSEWQPEIGGRVADLLRRFGHSKASVARELCDRYDPAAVAYRIVNEDGVATALSYAELREESERFAAALHGLGVGPGDRVATLMGKSREYLVTLMGIWRLGAVHVPLFTAFAPPAIALRLVGSGTKAVVCDAQQLPKLAAGGDMPADPGWRTIVTDRAEGRALCFAELISAHATGMAAAQLGGDAPFIQIYTSGTTGRPKGVVVPVRALAGFQAYAEFGLGLTAGDVFWCAADPGWAYGLYFGVIATLSTGVPAVLLQGGFSPEATWRVLTQERVTNFAAAPTVYRALRQSKAPARGMLALRRASSAGEPLTPDVNAWAQEALGMVVHDHYGQTEAGMLINNHHHPALAAPLKPGSMGRGAPGWSLTVLKALENEPADNGERGRIVVDLQDSPFAWFTGYVADAAKSADKFTNDGRWYLTGDQGHVDAEGNFFFASRDDDVIIMAGYRIGPFEVESVLMDHPAVAECAVYAVPDEMRGEVLEAAVVLRNGFIAATDTAVELQQWVKHRYAAHAYPRTVRFLAALPRTPSGKVQRFVLRQQARAGARAEAHAEKG